MAAGAVAEQNLPICKGAQFPVNPTKVSAPSETIQGKTSVAGGYFYVTVGKAIIKYLPHFPLKLHQRQHGSVVVLYWDSFTYRRLLWAI